MDALMKASRDPTKSSILKLSENETNFEQFRVLNDRTAVDNKSKVCSIYLSVLLCCFISCCLEIY
jgi:hypothetical protein